MSRRIIGVMLAAALGVPAVSCRGPALPATLQGERLTESIEGERAVSTIGHLHGRRGIAPRMSRIGLYGDREPRTTLYVSRFASAREARDQLEAMATRMGPGSSGFGHHRAFTIGGVEVHSVMGHGQAHYFYARGADLTWLAAPHEAARGMLAELLRVDAESVPVGTIR